MNLKTLLVIAVLGGVLVGCNSEPDPNAGTTPEKAAAGVPDNKAAAPSGAQPADAMAAPPGVKTGTP